MKFIKRFLKFYEYIILELLMIAVLSLPVVASVLLAIFVNMWFALLLIITFPLSFSLSFYLVIELGTESKLANFIFDLLDEIFDCKD